MGQHTIVMMQLPPHRTIAEMARDRRTRTALRHLERRAARRARRGGRP